MQFTLTVTYPDNNGGGRDQYDLLTMRAELHQLSLVLDALVVGEKVTIERIS